jgi:hypothetical protein
VRDDVAQLLASETVIAQEGVDVAGEVARDDFGHVGREHDLEAAVDEVPAHHVLGVAVERGARGHDARTVGAIVSGDGDLTAAQQHRRRTVAEQARGDDVGNRHVVALQGERAQLDREEQRMLVGKGAQIIGRARQTRRAGDAAEPEDGRALDVGAQPEAIDQARVDARRRQAGDRHEEDVADLRRVEAGTRQRAARRGLAELERHALPHRVGRGERADVAILVDGQRQVTATDGDGAVQLLEPLDVEVALPPQLAKGGDERLL